MELLKKMIMYSIQKEMLENTETIWPLLSEKEQKYYTCQTRVIILLLRMKALTTK